MTADYGQIPVSSVMRHSVGQNAALFGEGAGKRRLDGKNWRAAVKVLRLMDMPGPGRGATSYRLRAYSGGMGLCFGTGKDFPGPSRL
jgi:hypothetical protein